MQLIIAASGRGSRLKNLTKNKPKILLKIFKNLTIFDLISQNFKKFSNIFLVGGHKYIKFKQLGIHKKCNLIRNRKYLSSNMVETIFLAKKKIKSDVVISYGDIVFDEKIIDQMLKVKTTCLPLNSNWLKNWKQRMSLDKIRLDAENVITSKNKVKSIGGKIGKKLPKLQFMGLIRIKKKDYFKLYNFYKKINNKNIDLTSFLNLSIQNKIINLNFFKTNKKWAEIDSKKDYYVAKNIVKNGLFKDY